MRSLWTLPLVLFLLLPASGHPGDGFPWPEAFGIDPVMTREGEPGSWTRDTMYEHINGEAELLKRYGAQSLEYARYEGGGASLAADVLDMGSALNAFGLFRLYAGCDPEEVFPSGAVVLPGEYTSYVLLGRYFMRIDAEGSGSPSPLKAFLVRVSAALPLAEPLPRAVTRLQGLARKPCEVGYHPEDVDYDLQAGPGYTWTGPEGGAYFLRLLPTSDEAEILAATLRDRGAPTVLVWGNAVTWPRVRTPDTAAYLKGVLRKVVEW